MKIRSNFFFIIFLFLSPILKAQFNWLQKSSLPASARSGAVAFSIGNKGYLGTGGGSDFWEYNPIANSWTQKANFGGGFRIYAAGFSIGNFGFIGTGQDFSGNPTNDFWQYDPFANTWTQKANVGPDPRMQAVAFSVMNYGYIGTGWDGFFNKPDFWKYDPFTDTWLQITNFGGGSVRDIDRAVFVIGNSVYLAKGYDGTTYYNDLWQYDQATSAWTQKATMLGMGRKGAVGFSICGYGFMGLGLQAQTALSDFYMYDPTLNSWSSVNSFPSLPRWDIPSFVINNKAYLGTGNYVDSSSGTPTPMPTNDFWEFFEPPVNATINSNSIICIGDTISLNASGGLYYLWNTGATTNSISVSPTNTTTYSVSVAGICSNQTVSTTVTVINTANSTFSYSYDPCLSKCVSFIDQSTNAFTWEWDFGDGNNSNSNNPCHRYSDSSTYSVSLIIDNLTACADTFSLQVPYVDYDTSAYVFIPTAFSPNGDGQNDKLQFFRKDNFCLQKFEIKIYDRWGEKVFETNNISDSWDGTFNGQPLNSGEFVFYCKANSLIGIYEKKGGISLIR